MSGHVLDGAHSGRGAPGSFRLRVSHLEETLIALILGLMTIITFVNVVARYGFNSNILWALEVTSFLFAWLVLLGASYCVKITAHLGVDAIINLFSAGPRRIIGILAAACCIIYAFLLLKGGWDYWSNFANLPQTEGRWFPTGFQEKYLGKAWYETNDTPMPSMFQFLADWMNEGEAYEKIPRFIPYFIMPLSMALLLYRFVEVGISVVRGHRTMMIVSHEAEDAVEEASKVVAAGEAADVTDRKNQNDTGKTKSGGK